MVNFNRRFFGAITSFIFIMGMTNIFAQIESFGGFEAPLPSYWQKGNEPAGATLTWATDQSRSMGHSLKITKSATSAAAMWQSENMADFWSPQHLANVDMKVGAYVRTENVNTNPADSSETWYISYAFYDSLGALIGETKLPIDQSVPTSSGWVADTNAVGQTILPKDSWKTIISFVGGPNATGTVWADDFILAGRGAWAGQDWNTAVGVPAGWIYWLPPNGGNDGLITNGFENTVVTTEEAHSGLHSLKFYLPSNRAPHDAFVGTKRFLFNNTANVASAANSGDITTLDNVMPGDHLRISVWVKADSLVPDSAAANPVTWAIGFTYGFFKGNGNNDGFNNIPGFPVDTQFTLPPVTSFGWRQFHLDVTVPNDPMAKALAVRLHVYARFTGVVYFDDLTVEKLNVTAIEDPQDNAIPKTYELANNYPNPFNPSTTIEYGLPKAGHVSIKIYNVLGQKVRTLLNGQRPAGRFKVVWNGRDDFGNNVSSGMYFYRLKTDAAVLVKKMILLK